MSQAGPLNNNGGGGTVPGDVATSYITDAGTGVPSSNVLNVIGGTGITTSASGDTITISATGTAGFNWVAVTSVSPANPIQIVVGTGYVCNGVSNVTFILPLAPTFGDEFAILSNTATFLITQNGSQAIRIGSAITTTGSGTAHSNTVGDFIQALYVGSNLFISFAPQGTISLN
jgi:hypothetical protein